MSIQAPADTSAFAVSGPRGRRAVVGIMLVAAALIIAYWAVWFGVDRTLLASSHTAVYYGFENAFPAADGWLALTLIMGAVGLAMRKPFGLLFGLLAGGAGIYLGCMDVLFDLENAVYVVPHGVDPSPVFIEIAINILTFTLGAVLTLYIWRHRNWYLAA